MTERARMGGQYGVDPWDGQGAGDSSGNSATNIFTYSKLYKPFVLRVLIALSTCCFLICAYSSLLCLSKSWSV